MIMRNKNKCRICGYRFKSPDEIICPECFTARDDDVSCSNYSDDLHSHDLRDNNYFGSPENDTFKEKKNDFVAEERKEEAADKNFRSQNNGSANTFNSPFGQQIGYNSTREQKLAAIRSNASNYQSTFNSNIASNPIVNRQFNSASPKKQNRGCLVAVVIFFIAVFIVPFAVALIEAFSSENSYNYDDDYDYSYVEDEYTASHDKIGSSLPSDYGDYTVTYSGLSTTTINKSDLTAEQQNTITEGLDENDTFKAVTVTLYVEPEDDDTQVKLSSAFTYSTSDDGTGYVSANGIAAEGDMDTYYDDHYYTITFYTLPDATELNIYAIFQDSDLMSNSFTFSIDLSDADNSADLSNISGVKTAV